MTEVLENGAKVDVNGHERLVTSALPLERGDFVVIGMGVVLEKISEKRFKELSVCCL